MLFLLLLACGDDATTTTADSAPTGATTDTQDTGPTDRDQDGVIAKDDCDDLDDRRYPGNEETWDGVDNDCDELVDGDGAYSGTTTATATTVYEGITRNANLSCDIALTRSLGVLDYTVTCPVTHTDPDEEAVWQLIMGEQLVMTIDSGYESVSDQLWSGRTTITAEAGWDSTGDAQVAWTSVSEARWSFVLDAAQLGMSGNGTITR